MRVEEREDDRGQLEEELSRKNATRQVGRAVHVVWPERQFKTEWVGQTTWRPYAPSGAKSDDDDDDDDDDDVDINENWINR